MNRRISKDNCGAGLRYGILIPMALMIAAVITSCFSYSAAKHEIANDLNDAILALADENSELWTRQDTITALRQMREIARKPLIYQASDVKFRNPALKDKVYFTLALVDKETSAPIIRGNKIASDSIMLVPERAAEGVAIHVQCFVDCSMASVFAASDQTLPGILFSLALISMAGTLLWKRRETEMPVLETAQDHSAVNPLDGIRLTPMQRQLTQMLLEAPGLRVDKATLCYALWGNKSNAEESLYTLVRRTKTALAEADIEIICNRGDSYELRVNR